MSWQTYVDEHLMCDIDGTGHHLTAAAIIGHDGSVWAQSSSFPKVYSSFHFPQQTILCRDLYHCFLFS
jgi:hypothetical protein